MAPEQAAGQEPDPRQDLYALGVLGRVLLTGVPPRALAASLSQDAGSPLWPWLVRLSATDPAARPASAGEARAELARIGLPDDAPWAGGPDAPEVFDQLGPDPVQAVTGSVGMPLTVETSPAGPATAVLPTGPPPPRPPVSDDAADLTVVRTAEPAPPRRGLLLGVAAASLLGAVVLLGIALTVLLG